MLSVANVDTIQLYNKEDLEMTTERRKSTGHFPPFLPPGAGRGPARLGGAPGERSKPTQRSSGVVIHARPIRSPWSSPAFINHRYPERTLSVFRQSQLRRHDPAGDLALLAGRSARRAAGRRRSVGGPAPSLRLDQVVHK